MPDLSSHRHCPGTEVTTKNGEYHLAKRPKSATPWERALDWLTGKEPTALRATESEPEQLGTPLDVLEGSIAQAQRALLSEQEPDGHWCYELEADCTIPSEYILMMHFMGEIDEVLENKLARYIRSRRDPEHGGWPLYTDGHQDLSCTIKAYYALKLAGDDPDAEHMAEARRAILDQGGAARANVFTRILLAQFKQIPWRGTPLVPPEIVLFPRWFPFHLSKVSYWSRTVMVPLSILYALGAQAQNPRGIGVQELFTTPPEKERKYFPVWSWTNLICLGVERSAARLEFLLPNRIRRRSLQRARDWVIERLNGEDGLGAIFPAMVNAYEALAHLGYGPDHPYRIQAGRALRHLVVDYGEKAYCQPCVSPIWDTALAVHALQESGEKPPEEAVHGLDWLVERQVTEPVGDWRETHPDLPAGGWAFQYNNAHYPDLDDTAAVAIAMHQSGLGGRYGESVARALTWIRGMQSRDGGFAAFDSDNTYYYLNHIPFADHGALLDPPTCDVTARCVGLLGQAGGPDSEESLQRAIEFLRHHQEPEGPWFGRWGTNYIYGTWSVLDALAKAGEDMTLPWIQRAVAWLKETQQPDGGWGEENDSYFQPERGGRATRSTPFHTAWALLALLAAGERDSEAVAAGIEYLLRTQHSDGLWQDPWFTAPGFPRVFHLKYHGYTRYFPLQALARYRRLIRNPA